MKLKRHTTLRKLILDLCQQYRCEGEKSLLLDNGWCLYSSEKTISLESDCYIDEYPDYDDEDNELLSEYVIQNDMHLVYRDEMIQDVICNGMYQKSNINCEEIKMALDYYEKYDTFIKF